MRTSDKLFLKILSKIRQGKVDSEVVKFLNSRKIKPPKNDLPRILSRNYEVDKYNLTKLNEIKSPVVTCKTQYAGEPWAISRIKENLVVPDNLLIKKGALVMLRVNNFKENYINGTIGTIIGITESVLTIKKLSGEIIHVQKHVFEFINGNGEVLARARNFPLTLAWAITIHKSQGASLDQALISIDRLWLHGQAYTALSRLTSSKGLFLTSWDKQSFKVDKKVIKYAKQK